MFKLLIDLGNDAFSKHPGMELARILREKAVAMEDWAGHEFRLGVMDINGNCVGEMTVDKEHLPY